MAARPAVDGCVTTFTRDSHLAQGTARRDRQRLLATVDGVEKDVSWRVGAFGMDRWGRSRDRDLPRGRYGTGVPMAST
jgi:hypothetical protein